MQRRQRKLGFEVGIIYIFSSDLKSNANLTTYNHEIKEKLHWKDTCWPKLPQSEFQIKENFKQETSERTYLQGEEESKGI